MAQREASCLPITPGSFPLKQNLKISGNKLMLKGEISNGPWAEMKTE